MKKKPVHHDGLAEEIFAQIGQKSGAHQSQYGFKPHKTKLAPFLTAKQLAAQIGVSTKTLERWRSEGKGPPYLKTATGRIRYLVAGLDEWAKENMAHADSPESSVTK